MPEAMILHPSHLLPSSSAASLMSGVGVVVAEGRVVEIGELPSLRTRWQHAEVLDLTGCILMPGLINAHQHGRGLSQIQIGHHDLPLETWVAQRRARGILDAYPLAKLTALNMLANGVTTAVQANFAFGSGDYEQEFRDQCRGYDEAGIRVTMCLGAMDRGGSVYPPHEACFMAGLPLETRAMLANASTGAYAGNGQATVALMGRLLGEFENHPRIRLCYGPAGPQWVTDELFGTLAKDAADKGLGMHMHALESPIQRKAMGELYPEGVFKRLESLGAMNERTVVAHCVWANEEDADVLARTGATVVRNPGCNLRLSNGIAPIARYMAQGVRVAIGTDNHTLSDDEDLLSELRLASYLARDPEWKGSPAPQVDDLLAMATVNGAVAAQFPGEIGEIRKGMRADLVAFSLDTTREPYLDNDMPLLEAFLARARGGDTRLTMVEGRILFRDGKFTSASFNAIVDEAAEAARKARRPKDSANIKMAADLRTRIHDHYRHYASQSQ
ncbi:amidohydrolase family protein [Mesorhizobium sp. M7A.F.Ca.US.006.01.1.1]|uniref:amidohydrolase family protein n=1 Tax=Mesorhizobium sp. M7A.F.Ca.US.006.01.1.1 TaxID=2496707 RepID=UPI0013E34F2D|nr:amidohydrolase family protein [Mesorhizobium sp. M7A.F.Ca.US.006.01.1.1]